jgi:hypothetical protein
MPVKNPLKSSPLVEELSRDHPTNDAKALFFVLGGFELKALDGISPASSGGEASFVMAAAVDEVHRDVLLQQKVHGRGGDGSSSHEDHIIHQVRGEKFFFASPGFSKAESPSFFAEDSLIVGDVESYHADRTTLSAMLPISEERR